MSDNEFKSDAWVRLGVTERVAHCQIMNNEALMLAENADPNEAAAYRSLARAWMKLADAIGQEALVSRNTEKGNLAPSDDVRLPAQSSSTTQSLLDDIPLSEQSASDVVPVLQNHIPRPEQSANDAPQVQPDRIPPPDRSFTGEINSLHKAIQKFSEAIDRQASTTIRLTHTIVFLTVAILFSVGAKIWLSQAP